MDTCLNGREYEISSTISSEQIIELFKRVRLRKSEKNREVLNNPSKTEHFPNIN